MRSFFKILLACFAAITLTLAILSLVGVKLFMSATVPEIPEVKKKTVLVLDLSKPMAEQTQEADFKLPEGKTPDVLGVFDIVRAIKQAAGDTLIKGILIKSRSNTLGFAASTEIRNALLEFKQSKKFIIGWADYFTQRGYEMASVADKVYCQPGGEVDWMGYSMELMFFKGLLSKLDVKPEIFFAGQYKSATEPYRFDKMSDPNRRQMTEFIGELYSIFLQNVAQSRKLDTATLRKLANDWTVRYGSSSQTSGLVDGMKYEDELQAELRERLSLKEEDKIAWMPMSDYVKNKKWDRSKASDHIAVLYADGDIVISPGHDGRLIVGEKYRELLRKIREDKKVKALVLRVNSPGGSALASEGIWREIMLTRKVKPVVVSMGNYAASGGYYISCAADSIFAQPNTLTGSIGVFSMYFDARGLFNNKLGITFDGVKTAEHADCGSLVRSMTAVERQIIQEDIDSLYITFKQRVAAGRRMDIRKVDSIAQGHIWSGRNAQQLGLVDRLGGLQDAIDCAGRMAKLKEYQVKEWPQIKTFVEKILGAKGDAEASVKTVSLQEQLGAENYELLQRGRTLQSWAGLPQARLPFFCDFK